MLYLPVMQVNLEGFFSRAEALRYVFDVYFVGRSDLQLGSNFNLLL